MFYLALMFTQQCNANCRHCSVRNFMGEAADMPLTDAFRYVDEMAELSTDGDGFTVYLSGGEPFLRYHDLLAVVLYAKKRGASQISCITNGFWGREPATARQCVTELRDAGLTQMCFSLDDFHQEYVPLVSVIPALTACREMGLCFSIKCTVTRRTSRLAQILSELGDLLLDTYVSIQELAYVPRLNTEERIPHDEWLVQKEIPHEPCPELRMLAICPDGTTFPCCGSGWTQQLVIGNALTEPVAELVRKVRERPLFALLRDKGPGHLVPYFAKGGFSLPHESYVNRCHLCRTVLDHSQSGLVIELALRG